MKNTLSHEERVQMAKVGCYYHLKDLIEELIKKIKVMNNHLAEYQVCVRGLNIEIDQNGLQKVTPL